MADDEDKAPLELTACVVDLSRGRFSRDGATRSLTALELGVLRHLRGRPGEVVSRDELLQAVWGYDQAVLTRSVDNTVSRLRAKIERDASAPDHVLTVHGEGYRFIPEPAVDGPASGPGSTEAGAPNPPTYPHPPEAPLAPALGRAALPRASSPFIGREAELERLSQAFGAGARLVTLLGTGGVGKTRLATRWVEGEGAFAQAWFCDLASATDAYALVRAVAAALELPLEEAADGGVGQVGRALGARGRGLLIADNLEQAVEAARGTLGPWLAAAPALRILATSRAPLGIDGEVRVPVGPFDVAQGRLLFEERARAARGGAPVMEGEREAVAALVERLDGLPLAIELAAARASSLAPSAILARLDARGAILGRRPTGPERHSTVEAAIAWSWDLLGEAERSLLCRLSLFHGGATLEAVEGVAPASPGEPPPAQLLASLVDQSLVQVHEGPRGARYRMFEGVRAFAAGKLAARGDAPEARARYARWVQAQARAWAQALEGPDPFEAAAALRVEAPNLRQAARWALGDAGLMTPDLDLAADLCISARWVALTQGPLGPWVDLAGRLLVGWPGDPRVAARLYLLRGELRHLSGALAEATEDLTHALTLGAEAGDRSLEAEAVIRLGSVEFFMGQVSEAQANLRAGAEIARAAGEPRLEGLARDRLGTFLHVLGAPAEARAEIARAQRAYQRAGARALAAQARANLALMDLELGRTARAAEHLEAAIELNRRMGNRRNEALLWINRAGVSREQGEVDAARAQLGTALTLARSFGLPRSEALALTALAEVEALAGALIPAREAALAAQALTATLGEAIFEGLCWAWLGAIDALDGGLDEAAEAFAEARALLEPTGAQARIAVVGVLEALLDLGRAGEADGPEAAHLLRQARARVDAVTGERGGGAPLAQRSSQVRGAVALVAAHLPPEGAEGEV